MQGLILGSLIAVVILLYCFVVSPEDVRTWNFFFSVILVILLALFVCGIAPMPGR